ncbi:YfaZ precursor [Sinobacterium caligoides]|uniref:YfaZ n=1 Tax=Sinobacterium caligoides TaxID=933926 RepID=A0A3N2DYC2_9GAMM|nr:YfaZ family outer membrane protein [Sinobacterium caligoides]ROS04860.1 YfaZ precursor [Sinobacterium caligoides]
MRKTLLTSTLALTSLLSVASYADNAGLSISDDSAKFGYEHETDTFSTQANWLYHEDNGSLYSGGLYAKGQEGMFSAKLGGKIYYADLEDGDGYGIALGGSGTLHITEQFRLIADLHYSPSILAFSDIERLKEGEIKAQFQALPNATIDVGYRNVTAKVDHYGNEKIDKGLFAGVNMSF